MQPTLPDDVKLYRISHLGGCLLIWEVGRALFIPGLLENVSTRDDFTRDNLQRQHNIVHGKAGQKWLNVPFHKSSLGFRGRLITNFPNVMVLVIQYHVCVNFFCSQQVYSQLIYLMKFIFTNRTSVDVIPDLISSKQTWFDVNGLREQKKFTQTLYYKGIA